MPNSLHETIFRGLTNHSPGIQGSTAGKVMRRVWMLIFLFLLSAGRISSQSVPSHQGLYFEGLNDLVMIPASPALNFGGDSAYTFQCWIKLQRTDTTRYAIASKGQSGFGNLQIALIVDSGRVKFYTDDNGRDGWHHIRTKSPVIEPNRWTHLAFVCNNASTKAIFVNGQPQKDTINRGTPNNTSYGVTSPWIFGNNAAAWMANPLSGQMDEVRIFRSARDSAQIASDMYATTPNGALGYWNFESGQGQVVVDFSGNYNGTLGADGTPGTDDPLWTFRVTRTTDHIDSLGSLRWALNQTNGIADLNYIDFSMPGGTVTFQPANTYIISEPVIIDGYTQYNSTPGENSKPNSAPFGSPLNSKLNVIINGALAGNNHAFLFNSSGSLIRGLVVNGFSGGTNNAAFSYHPENTNDNNTVEGCFVGTDRDGMNAFDNSISFFRDGGIGETEFNFIGGTGPQSVNLIANRMEFNAWASGTIMNNYIGVARDGVTSLNRNAGIGAFWLGTSGMNITGNIMKTTRTAISFSTNVENIIIRGNKISGKDSCNGIELITSYLPPDYYTPRNITIGGTLPGEGNEITNFGNGIFFSDADGGQSVAPSNILISGNNIHSNTISGINLNGSGNYNKQAPVITSAKSYQISGTCDYNDIVEIFYDTPQSGASNQGRQYIYYVFADGTNWTYSGSFMPGYRITATARDEMGNTSEFSEAAIVNMPTAPTGLFVMSGNEKVTLKWNKNPEADINRYRIFMGTTSKPDAPVDSTTGGIDDTTITITTGLMNNTMYYFRIAAVNASGIQSPYSNEDAAVPVVEAGRALNLDGVDDFAQIPYSPALALSMSDDFTISAWVKPVAANQTIFQQQASGYGTLQIWCWINERERLVFGTDDYIRGGPDMDSSLSTIPLNSWTHVAFVKQGSNKYLYINGFLDRTAPVVVSGSADAPSSGGINLGIKDAGNTFFGHMDEVQVWKTPLSQPQINAVKNKPVRGDETGLIGVWHFDEPQSEEMVYDGSKFGHNGSKYGAPVSLNSGAMAPLAPTGVIAVKHVPDSVVVKWNANAESDLRHYVIYRSLINNFIPAQTDSIGKVNKPGVSFSDITAIPGNQYFYRVTAVDSALQKGMYSAQASIFYGNPLTVYNTNNSGIGSLRAAVDSANARAGADTIKFYSGIKDATITLLSTITLLTGNGNGTVIDGDIDGDNKPSIIISGTKGNYNGIQINGNNNTIKYVNMVRHGVSFNSNGAISISGSYNRIIGNYFGTNLAGTDTTNMRNNQAIATGTGTGNIIGDTLPEFRNIISGNLHRGIIIHGSSHYILNNIIGLDVTGTVSLGGPIGVWVSNGTNNYIGNGTPAGRNIISGNNGSGIYFLGNSNGNTRVLGNYIGTDITGTLERGNSQDGIWINLSSRAIIGDGTPGGRNVISGNNGRGILCMDDNNTVINGNYIGVADDGITALRNNLHGIHIYSNTVNDSIVNNIIANAGTTYPGILFDGATTYGHKVFKNSIYNNGGPGISITNGAQQGILQPVIQFVAADSTVSGKASPNALVQIYADSSDEGRVFLDTVRANGSGNWSKKVTIPAGMRLTALQDSNGNTSAFSAPKNLTPVAPTGLTAIAGDKKVQLRWLPNTELDVSKYRVYWDVNPNPTILRDSTLSRLDTSIVIGGLNYGQTYYFRITAVNHIGNASAFSGSASAMPYAKGFVMNLLNAGVGSLRWAVDSANAYPGPDTIRFATGLKDSTIKLLSTITLQTGNGNGTVIDGDIDGDNKPSITLDGQNLSLSGILIYGSNNHIKNLNIVRCGSIGDDAGIGLNGIDAFNNRISGNYIGTNLSGSTITGTGNLYGIAVVYDANNNIIGDTVPEGRNIVSGNGQGINLYLSEYNIIVGNFLGTDATGMLARPNNQHGIWIQTANLNRIGNGHANGRNLISGNTNTNLRISHSDSVCVLGNLIGTNINGTGALTSPAGIFIDFSSNTMIGDGTTGGRNVISGHSGNGIYISSSTTLNSANNRVLGNFIGTDITGTLAVPNSSGIYIGNYAVQNYIGDGTVSGKNIISGNTGYGIRIQSGSVIDCGKNVVAGNNIGINAAGAPLMNNSSGIFISNVSEDSILSNNIAHNGLYGIYLDGANTDSNIFFKNSIYNNAGPGILFMSNAQKNVLAPVIQFVSGDSTVSGHASPNALVQIYADSTDEGRVFLDTVRANGSGNWSKKVTIPAGMRLTALQDSSRNTSMFSNPYILSGDIDLAGKTQSIFGNVGAGLAKNDTVTVYNIAAGVLTLDSLSIKNGTTAFTIIDTIPDINWPHLMPGNSVKFVVRFNPSGFAGYTDSLRIKSNDPDEPVVYVRLTGSGIAGSLTVDQINNDFGSLPCGDSLPTVVKIYPSGGMVHITSGVSFNNPDFKIDSLSLSLPRILALTDTLKLYAKFSPRNFGLLADSLVIQNNSTDTSIIVRFTGNSLAGNLAANPSSYNFSNVAVGDSAQTRINVLANSGAVYIPSVDLFDGAAFRIDSVSGLIPRTLFSGDTLRIYAKFSPQNFGSHDDTIFINNNSSDNPLKIALSGAGSSGTLSASFLSHNFGDIPVSTSDTMELKLYAVSGPVRIDSLYLINNSDFAVQNGYTLPLHIMAGDSISINLTFTPATFAGYNDVLRIVNNSSTPQMTIDLTGNGVPGNIVATTDHITFGDVPVSMSDWMELKLYAPDGSVRLDSIILQTGLPYSLSGLPTLPRLLDMGDSVQFTVQFTPTAYGSFSDVIRIVNNSSFPVISIQLTGNGVSGTLAVSADTLNFGEVGVGVSKNDTVTVYNIAGGMLTLDSLSIKNGTTAFTIIDTIPNVNWPNLMPNDSVKFVVRFNPSSFTGYADSLRIRIDDPVDSITYVRLEGTGIAGSLTVDQINNDFGSLPCGDSLPTVVKIYPSGGMVHITSGVSFNNPDFKIDSLSLSLPRILALTDTLKLYAKFSPRNFGLLADSLVIQNNSTDPLISVRFTGNSLAGNLAANPSSYNFSNVAVGDSAQTMINVLANSGAVYIPSVDLFSGAAFRIDSVSGLIPRTLFSGDTLRIYAKFSPQNFGSHDDTIFINNNSSDNPFKVVLTGTGVSGSLAVSADTLDFGNVPVSTSDTVRLKLFTSGGSVRIDSLNFANPNGFTIDDFPSLPRIIGPNDTLSLRIRFTPASFGGFSDVLRIVNNSSLPVQSIHLAGTGVSGSLTVSADTLDFGNVPVSTSDTVRLKLFTSGGSVRIDSLNFANPNGFSIDDFPSLPRIIGPNDTLSLRMRFTPASFGSFSDVLRIVNNSSIPVKSIQLTGNGVSGTLAVSADTLNFGEVGVGVSKNDTVTVYNIAGGMLTLDSLSIKNGTTAFTIIDTIPNVNWPNLMPNDSVKFVVRFNPSSFTGYADSLRIRIDDPVDSIAYVRLEGTGIAGSLTVDQINNDFGSLPCGDSLPTVVRIYPSGGMVHITSGVSFNNPDFKIDSLSLSLPRILALTDTLKLYAKFRPRNFGELADSLVIQNNSTDPLISVRFTGNSLAGNLAANPSSYNFSNVAVGDSAQTMINVLANSGAVYIPSVDLFDGAAFRIDSVSGLIPRTLFSGDTLRIYAEFRPQNFGSHDDTIFINNNSSDNPFKVVLTGTGVSGALAVSADTLDFGNVLVSSSDTVRLKIFTSGGPVRIDSLNFANPNGFSIDDFPSLPRIIGLNDTLSLRIRFTPASFGSFSDVLRIVNNSSLPVQSIQLTGNGVSGALAVSADTLDFGNVLVSSSDTVRLKIFTSGGPVRIDSLNFANPNGFSIDDFPSLPRIIGLNDTLSLRIRFTPASFGSFSDVLRIVNNSSLPVQSIQLTGNGQAGNLRLSTNDLNYPLIQTGDSSVAQFKMYPTLGVVRVDSIRLVSPHFTMAPLTLPQILSWDNQDTVAVTVTYRPQSAGHHTDTVYIYSNAVQYSLWTLKLEGDAYSNSAPYAFDLKTVGTNNLTNSRTPALSWENRGDPDSDVIQYRVDVSLRSDFVTLADTATTYDSVYTVRTTLDSSATYYWRVTATDPKGAATVSETRMFRIDAVAAELTLGTFFGSVLKQYLSVGVITNKRMQSLNGSIGLRGPENTLLDTVSRPFDLISADNRYYQMPYKLGSSGKLYITVTGTDSAMNTATLTRDYTIGAIAKEQALAMNSGDGNWQIAAAKRTFGDDGYLMVSRLNRETKTLKDKSVITMAKASGGWADAGEGLNIQGSAAIREGQGFMVTLKYGEDVIAELQTRYTADFDERKIGLYAENNGAWVYTGGEGKNGQVQAKVKSYGMVKLMYNPDHEFLPTKVELAQNYPNPFNPTTTIRFGVPQDGKVKLTVYNVLGQKVKELVNDSRNAGYYNVVWNGRSDRGSAVTSGVYLYRLETSQGVVVKKMALLK